MPTHSASLFNLSGRVILATGGASGIGLGFLTGCARLSVQRIESSSVTQTLVQSSPFSSMAYSACAMAGSITSR